MSQRNGESGSGRGDTGTGEDGVDVDHGRERRFAGGLHSPGLDALLADLDTEPARDVADPVMPVAGGPGPVGSDPGGRGAVGADPASWGSNRSGSPGSAPADADGSTDRSNGARSAELRAVPLASVRPNQYQPRRRFDEAALEELADSITQLGVLQPILVRPLSHGHFELIAGERRWRAARRAGLQEIPAVVRTVTDVESLEEAIVENLHRADLNAIEEANAYQQLIDDFELTQDQVSQRVGRSRSAVANTLRLLQLAPSVQRMVMAGRLSAGHARTLVAVTDPGRQRELAEYMVDARLSVRQAEELVRARTDDPGGLGNSAGSAGANDNGVAAPDRPVAVLEVERRLGDLLDTKVVVTERSKNGTITIEFADRDDLGRIYGLLHPLPS